MLRLSCLFALLSLSVSLAAKPVPHAAAKAPAHRGKIAALATVATAAAVAAAAGKAPVAAPSKGSASGGTAALRDGEAEARLLTIYKLIGAAKTREALRLAEELVRDFPHFQLAQLAYGDLLSAQARPLQSLGDIPPGSPNAALLGDLRDESLARLRALRERPPANAIPSQFLHLSPQTRHAIAVDASRSRLYLFEASNGALRLIRDYYISVGKLGIDKVAEGDQRTPLGVYFVTSFLPGKSLKDMYGVGALPINYPNPLDQKRGKTGSGIWLHGTPSSQFARAPKSSDGCVVLSNPDLQQVMNTVEIRSTPVVIAPQLRWVTPTSMANDQRAFETVLGAWRDQKNAHNLNGLMAFYAPDFNSYGKTLEQWKQASQADMTKLANRKVQLKDVSYYLWQDTADTMVVTFGELVEGSATGRVLRQYWGRSNNSPWKIFFEGVIG